MPRSGSLHDRERFAFEQHQSDAEESISVMSLLSIELAQQGVEPRGCHRAACRTGQDHRQRLLRLDPERSAWAQVQVDLIQR